MDTDIVRLEIDARGVATATLNRPAVHNAYNLDMLEALILGLEQVAADPRARCLVIRGAGRNFQAGADIKWLNGLGRGAFDANHHASLMTTRAMQRLNEFPKPTIALIRGACFGGGCGIVCCVDVALATPDARFGITEVRVGVAPTPISTHMVNAIGLRHTRRYALTGETFDAMEAQRIGLVHEVVEESAIEAKLATIVDAIYRSGPGAMADTKRSFLLANNLLLNEGQVGTLSLEGAVRRAGAEGLEGTAAFAEKRLPSWYIPPPS